jgi:hypothetical protein
LSISKVGVAVISQVMLKLISVILGLGKVGLKPRKNRVFALKPDEESSASNLNPKVSLNETLVSWDNSSAVNGGVVLKTPLSPGGN